MIDRILDLYEMVCGHMVRAADEWLMGLLARLAFAAVLLMYFLNSAFTKFDGSLINIADAAYFQIVPPVVEAAGYDASAVAFFPWGLLVYAGSYGEIILPLLIVFGLFTRIAAIGMTVFIMVQSYVDINFHHVDAATVGSWFDNISGAAILDQRALWALLFGYLLLKGAGKVSLDAVVSKWFLGGRPL
jgi:putative oxidoreductase